MPVTRDKAVVRLQLGRRGRRLWREMDGETLPAGRRELLEEACRLADRLDRLDAILTGEAAEWLRLHFDDTGTRARVVVDRVLSEARQQQLALARVLAELRQGGRGTAPTSRAERQAAKAGGAGVSSGVADLTARIASRRTATTG